MPINLIDARAATRAGVSAYCATCSHYWNGRDLGLDRCTAPTSCGSPLAGHEFEHYDGPITESTRWCMACGNPADGLGIARPGSAKVFGLCVAHQHIAEMQPVDGPAPFVVVRRGGDIIAAQSLVKPKRNKLLDAMWAQQQEWDEDFAKKTRR